MILPTRRLSAPVTTWWTLFCICLPATLAAIAIFAFDPHVVDEDGPVEILEAVLLTLAVLFHTRRAAGEPRDSLSFLIHAGMSVLSLIFLIRELDIREWDVAGGVLWHRVEHIVRAAGLLGLIGYALFALPSVKKVFRLRMQILRLPVILQALTAGLFLVSGWPFDNGIFSHWDLVSKFMEEALEMNGYLIMAACAGALSDLPEWYATRPD